MTSIWTISITSTGVGACALSPDANYQTHFEPLAHHPCPASDLFQAVDLALTALSQASPQPSALALLSEETACFVDATGQPRTPIYFASPLAMPRRDVPTIYAESPELFGLYRNSILRRLQQTQPELGIQTPLGITTASGLIMKALTDVHVDALAPLGLTTWPLGDEMDFRALGVIEPLCVRLVRHSRMVTTIRPDILSISEVLSPWLNKLANIPVFLMGHTAAGTAYASAANPLSWSATLGWHARVQWTASSSALSKYEISIKDHVIESDASTQTDEKTRDEWTRILADKLKCQVVPGVRRSDSAFICSTPSYRTSFVEASLIQAQAYFEQNRSEAPWFAEDVLSLSAVGSSGLHLWPSSTGLSMTGLQASHAETHLIRAVFESQAYALRTWRAQTELEGLGPLRVTLGAPWDISCAQILCDALNSTIFVIDEQPASLSALGGAIALMRDLTNGESTISPHLSAWQLNPTESAAIYEQHYMLHTLVQE